MKRILLSLAMLFAFNQAQAVAPDAFYRPFVGTGQLLELQADGTYSTSYTRSQDDHFTTAELPNGSYTLYYPEDTFPGIAFAAIEGEGAFIALFNGKPTAKDLLAIAIIVAGPTPDASQQARINQLTQTVYSQRPTKVVRITIDITNVFEAVPHNLTDGITHALSDIFDKVPDMMDKGEI